MSDHADKLRRLIPDGDGHYSEYAGVLADAADCIDRLLAERDALREIARDLIAWDERWPASRTYGAGDQERVLRGLNDCLRRFRAVLDAADRDAAVAGREGA